MEKNSSNVSQKLKYVYSTFRLWNLDNSKLEFILQSNILYFFIIFLFSLMYIVPVTDSWFILIDDHEIIRIATGTQTISSSFQDDLSMGRYRPVYWIIRFLFSFLFSDDVLKWHIANFIIAQISFFFFFLLLKRLSVGNMMALLITLLLVFSPTVTNSWLRLGPQEAIGNLFFIIAMFFATKIKNSLQMKCLYIVFLILTALSKETYLVMIPLLMGVSIYSICKETNVSFLKCIRNNYLLVYIPIVVFIINLLVTLYIALSSSELSNGRSVLTILLSDTAHIGKNIELYLNTLQYSLSLSVFSFLLFCIGLVIGFLHMQHKKKSFKRIAFYFFLLSLGLVPQIMIYAGRTYMSLHYVVPAYTVLIALLAAIIHEVSHKNILSKVLILIAICSTYYSTAKNSVQQSYSYYLSSLNFKKAISLATQKHSDNSPNQKIIIFGHPSNQIEEVFSLSIFLKNAGSNHIYFYPHNSNLNLRYENADLNGSDFFAQDRIILNDFSNIHNDEEVVMIEIVDLIDNPILPKIEMKYKKERLTSIQVMEEKGYSDYVTRLFTVDPYAGWTKFRIHLVGGLPR